MLELLRSRSESVPVEGTGCLGHCYAEPMVEVVLDGGDSVFYRNVKAENGYIDNILRSARRTGSRFRRRARRRS
ncbi:MAG: (2Fe-2S) ferredoxin domain-containing protein [Oscillospiraceae bacterium]